VPEDDVFARARVTLTWHYQWITVHDFLPRLVGTDLVEQVLAEGGRWFAPAPLHGYIPLEFADAAFRYGHGQIRHTYRLVEGGPAVPLFPDLIGFGPLPAGRRLDLAQVFDVPGRPPAQRAKRLDGRLPASLIGLPEQVTGAVGAAAYRSLAVRDLLRGENTRLPSGEAVARLIGAAPLTAQELDQAWPDGTPLWFYVLKEAEVRGGGDRLGPVGGRIVTEVLIGLLCADPASYLSLEPDWRPTLPAAGPRFGLTDLLTG
jgi:Animal haem peroxidase